MLSSSIRTTTLAATLLATVTLGSLALAQPAAAIDTTHLNVSKRALGATQQLAVESNKSVIVDLPANVTEVVVSQPAMASVIMRTKSRAIIQGLGAGDTNIFFFDANGATVQILDVSVSAPHSSIASALQDALARILPGSGIRVDSVGSAGGAGTGAEHVVLSGYAASQDDVARATVIAAQFAGSADAVANLVSVSGSQQVQLKVQVAEINRTTIKQLGIDLNGSVSLGNFTGGFVNNPTIGGASGAVPDGSMTAGFTAGGVSISATLQALERRGAVRMLAEPTLTALSGQPAEFLAGGQVPISTKDDAGNTVTDYKDYGVKLDFTPTVKSSGIIGLKVTSDISDPNGDGSFSDRRTQTSVELPAGTTLAIGGLLKDEIKQEFNSFPGLGNIPILGALFRSRDFIHNQTELVVLVTPQLVYAGPAPALPTDSYVVAGDAEAIFLGHLEKMYGVGSSGGMRPSYSGSVGFVLD